MKKIIITSNHGCCTYKLEPWALIDTTPKMYYRYFVTTTELRRGFQALAEGASRFNVSVFYSKCKWVGNNPTNKRIMYFEMAFMTNGYLRIGCRSFSRTATAKLRRMAGL